MVEIDFEEKAAELLKEVRRLRGSGIKFAKILTWHGVRGAPVEVPNRILDVTDVKEMQAILELAWAEHCLTEGV